MQKINQLSVELASIKTERDKLDYEAIGWAKKRDSSHEQIRKLNEEASNIKQERDALNQEVKRLKNLREQAKARRKEKHNEIRSIEDKTRALLEKKPSRNRCSIQREIESLEWKIQTTSLTVKQEEEIISQVRRLEIQHAVLKQLQESKNRLIELQTEERAFAAKARFHHEKLSGLAQHSQRLHERRVEILNQIKNLKAEADNAHLKCVETRRKADVIHQRVKELQQKINDLKQKQRRVEETKRTERQIQLLDEAYQKALEKMKRGEKLTLEEFRLLREKETGEKGALRSRSTEKNTLQN